MSYISPTGQKVMAASPNTGKVGVADIPTKETSQKLSINSAEEFRKFIEVEVLKIIKKLAEGGKTPKERIQEIARRTLELIKPGMSLEELYQNAVKLDDYHPELAPVVFTVMKEYEQKYEKMALEQVSSLVRSGKYDEAQNLVKKVLEFKVVG